MPKQAALPLSLPPRLITRETAAAYVCVSVAKFDQMVADGRMPKPRCIDRRRAWDVRALDMAVDRLPQDGEDPIDDTWADVLGAA